MDQNSQISKRCIACDVAKTPTVFLPSKHSFNGLTARYWHGVLIASARLREERETLREFLRAVSRRITAGE